MKAPNIIDDWNWFEYEEVTDDPTLDHPHVCLEWFDQTPRVYIYDEKLPLYEKVKNKYPSLYGKLQTQAHEFDEYRFIRRFVRQFKTEIEQDSKTLDFMESIAILEGYCIDSYSEILFGEK